MTSVMVRTFFSDSPGDAAAALLDMSPSSMTKEELDRLADSIDRARKEGR